MGQTPSATLPANPPTGTTAGTQVCCACPAKGNVATNGDGTYFRTNYPPFTALFNDGVMLIERAGSGGTVEFTVKFAFRYLNDATAELHYDQVARLVHSAMARWSASALQVRVELTQPGCPVQMLRIKFKAEIVTGGVVDAIIYIDNTPKPPADDLLSYVIEGNELYFYLNGHGNPGHVMSHEMGHIFGLPDEYASVPGLGSPDGQGNITFKPLGDWPTVTYFGTATQTETPKVLPLEAPRLDEFDRNNILLDLASHMGLAGNSDIFAENLFWVAIEAEAVMQRSGMPASARVVVA